MGRWHTHGRVWGKLETDKHTRGDAGTLTGGCEASLKLINIHGGDAGTLTGGCRASWKLINIHGGDAGTLTGGCGASLKLINIHGGTLAHSREGVRQA